MAEETAVVSVIVVEAGDPPDGVTLAGEKEQAARLGSVPQEKLTVPAYPPTGLTVNVKVAVWPGVMVPDVGVAEMVKSGAAITIIAALEVLAALLWSPW
jgi:hypothetical protein